jgi:hypothetical protein
MPKFQRRNVVYEDEASLSGSDSGDEDLSQDSAGSLKEFIASDEECSVVPPPQIFNMSDDDFDEMPHMGRQVSTYDVTKSPSPLPNLSAPTLVRTPSVVIHPWMTEPPTPIRSPYACLQTINDEPPTSPSAEDELEEPETSSSRDRVRRFTMTLNNWTENERLSFHNLPDNEFKYKIYGIEVGQEGTPHLQAYCETKNKHTIAGLHKLITRQQGSPSRWAIFVSLGTAQQNIKYCKKGKNFFEIGKPPAGQGKRTDLDAVAEMVKSGSNMKSIAEAYPKSFIHYSKGIHTLMTTLNSTPRSSMTLGYWVFGETGSGKSRWAHNLTPQSTYVKDPTSKWFCGYESEDTVIIDDYRPSSELPFSFLLRIADRYKMQVQTKGGQVNFNSKRVIITSPHNIETTFAHLDFLKEGDIAQLKRRFKELEFGPGKLSHLLSLTDLETETVALDVLTQNY